MSRISALAAAYDDVFARLAAHVPAITVDTTQSAA